MTSLETILSGLLLLVLGSLVGSWIGSRNKVDCKVCLERRTACMEVIDQKFEVIKSEMKALKDLLSKIWKRLEDSNIMML